MKGQQFAGQGWGWGLGMAIALGAMTPAIAANPTPLQSLGDRLGQGHSLELAQVRLQLGSRSSRFRVGGFRRSGSCMAPGQALVPLVPPASGSTDSDSIPVDLTTEAAPTIWVYVPDLGGGKTAQLTLQDEMGTQELVSRTFQLSGRPGIVGIQTQLPAQQGLEVGAVYYWQLSVDCGGSGADANPVVSGWLSRAALGTSPSGTPSQRASFYAENGIWQDAVSVLGLARHQNPSQSQLNSDWRSLLEAAGLPEFATQPVVQVVP